MVDLVSVSFKGERMASTSRTAEALSAPAVSPLAAVEEAPWPLRRLACMTLLLITDAVALLAAASLGYLLWAGPVVHQPPSLYVSLLPLLCLFLAGYATAGLYPGFGVGAVETLRRFARSTSFVFLTLAAATFVLKLPSYYSRMAFTIAWGASLFSVPLLRFLVLSLVTRFRWWGEPTVLVGTGRWMAQTTRSLKNALSLGYRPVGILSPDPRWHGRRVEELPVLGGIHLAPQLARRGVRVALVGDGKGEGPTLSWLQQHFRHVVMIREYGDLPVERVRVCNLGGVLGIEFNNDLLRWQNRFLKRTLDILLGSLFIFLTSPLIVLGVLFVKLSSRGPAFFFQQREGLGGHPIRVWKLRTMYLDAEKRLEEFLHGNPELHREWHERFKLVHDPRIIPRVGAFLRRFSMDELPQFFSIIKGEMSLVGPRPFPEYHLKRFPLEFRELRGRVRPGLTGLWQVMVRSKGGIEEQMAFDTYYVRNWSVWLDLWILGRTLFAVVAGRGAC